MTLSAAAFASGGGTNLQALLDHETVSDAYRIVTVVSDRADAEALERARSAGREARVIPVSGRTPDEVARDTLAALEATGVKAVFLAGYLRLIPEAVVAEVRGRMLNVHPALLPAFGGEGMYGRRVHEAVLASGARVSGVTVHFVDEDYDRGSILAQWPVPVRAGDTAETLAARVLRVEHLLYPRAAAHLARALSQGRETGPFSPPADAFGLPDVSPQELAAQIDAAFTP